MIHMGSGDHSASECYVLVCELIEAFGLISGLQQPRHWDREPSKQEKAEHKREMKEAEWRVKEISRHISTALKGSRQ